MARKPKKSEGSAGRTPMAGEFRSGPVAGTTILDGVTFKGKSLHYAVVDEFAIFEGDIILGKASALAAADRDGMVESVGISAGAGSIVRWPDARIPYDIDPALPNQQRVTDAVAHWEANTRIRFVLRTPANAAQHPDFVRFIPGGGCSSSVGRQGGMQVITLGANCGLGNAIHEIGHTVGLWHEQSRQDRDTFVEIRWANIDPAMVHNFNQHIADGDDLGAYDFGSVMHYPATAFSINTQPTIVARQALPPGVVMGQRSGLSAGDIAGVHMMYPAAGPSTIKEVAKDPIADFPTFKEVRKEPVTDTIKELAKDPIRDTTFKEIRKDPLKDGRKDSFADPTFREVTPFPGPVGPRPFPGPFGAPSQSPFVLARPNRAGISGGAEAAALAEDLQRIADTIQQLEQQYSQMLAAYDATAQALADIEGQQT